MNRRAFLRGAVALGGAAALGGRWPAGARSIASIGSAALASAGSILDHPASECPIDTVVVLCMENRSFDHYFAWLATDESYLEAGLSNYGAGFTVNGRNDLTYQRADGSTANTFYLPPWPDSTNPYRGCGGHPDPSHGWTSGRVQRDAGFVAQGSGNDDFAIGYFLEPDLPCYAQVARHYTIFDNFFASLMASTYPNREYLHSGQSGGYRNNYLPIAELGFDWPTIWDRLKPAGVSAGMYAVDLPTTALWGTRLLSITHPIAQFFADAATGRLPQVTFVDPGFLSGMRTDDHPHGDMRAGQRFVATILETLQASPQWGSTAMFITYDEWGGFFDHVTPPVLPDDRFSTDDAENYGQTGFRLPVSVASPYARPGYVDHTVYDHTSILRFIEWRYLGAPAQGPGGSGWWLTERDHNANNIGASLADQRVNDFALDGSTVPLVLSAPCNGQWFQDLPGPSQVEDEVTPVLNDSGITTDLPLEISVLVPDVPAATTAAAAELSSFEIDRHLFETFGYQTEPSMTLMELLSP